MNTLSIMQPMALNSGSNQVTEPLSRIRAFIASISLVIARFLRGSMSIRCSGAILDHSSKFLTASEDGGITGNPSVQLCEWKNSCTAA